MLIGGCRLRGKPIPADRPVPSNEVLDFRQLYGQNCAGCHGASGQMGPAPPLNDELFRSIIPEKELLAVVSAGRKGTLMPAFEQDNGGTLTKNQVQVLVNEIKGLPYKIVEKTPGNLGSAQVVADANGLMPKWGKPAPAGAGIPPYLISAASGQKQDGDAGKGMAVFTRVVPSATAKKGKGSMQEVNWRTPSTTPFSWPSTATRCCDASSSPVEPIWACPPSQSSARTPSPLPTRKSATWWPCWRPGGRARAREQHPDRE